MVQNGRHTAKRAYTCGQLTAHHTASGQGEVVSCRIDNNGYHSHNREHALLIADSLANQRFTFFTKNVNRSLPELDMKYVFYYFFIIDEWCTQNTQVSSFPSVDMGKLKNYEMPVPPLEEQRRIVEILDKFDALTTDITAGLPAEIAARQKQYEYYRDKLLTFKEKIA